LTDRVLAHLQLAIGQKLRRREGFFFSWKDDAERGEGRCTLWIEASIPMVFRYNGGRMPTINREWVEVLIRSSNGASGLVLSAEPVENALPATGRVGSNRRAESPTRTDRMIR
jgi:hypothetical protein